MLEGNPVLPLGGPYLYAPRIQEAYAFLKVWCLPDYRAPAATEPQDLVLCLNLVLLHLPRPAASGHGSHATLATVPDTGQHYLSEEGCSTAHVTSLAVSSTNGVPIQSLVLGPFKSLVFSFIHTSLEELNGNPCMACESY